MLCSRDEGPTWSILAAGDTGCATGSTSGKVRVFTCMKSLTVKEIYTVFVCMSKQGSIYSAKCQCKAGLGQACSHVAALLFKLEDLKRSNTVSIPEDITSTGKLQQWHVPPKREVQPVPVNAIQFEKAQYGKNTIKAKQSVSTEPLSNCRYG